MKTKLMTLFLICILAPLFKAQTLVIPQSFKLENVADFLKANNYKIAEQKETFLKILSTDDGTLYLDVDPDKKYMHLNIKILLKDHTAKEKIEDLMGQIASLKMLSARYIPEDNSVFFEYYFWMTHGFTNETLLDAVNEFFLYQGDAYGLDKEKIFKYQ